MNVISRLLIAIWLWLVMNTLPLVAMQTYPHSLSFLSMLAINAKHAWRERESILSLMIAFCFWPNQIPLWSLSTQCTADTSRALYLQKRIPCAIVSLWSQARPKSQKENGRPTGQTGRATGLHWLFKLNFSGLLYFGLESSSREVRVAGYFHRAICALGLGELTWSPHPSPFFSYFFLFSALFLSFSH
jgi:hypothetical protein